jgi:predicted metalloprotease
MKIERSRRSRNVEDRRGLRATPAMAGGGIGIIVIAIVAMLLGVDPRAILQAGPALAPASSTETGGAPPADDAAADFVSRVLGDTEDVWREQFALLGADYREPTLVLFTDAVQSACGFTQSAVGPFYCPRDEHVYIDLGFYRDLREQLGAPGDFAQAYVIAHEVGHHVQKLLGIADQVATARQRASETEGNALSVRQELQADCLAGVWAFHANRERGLLDAGDVEEGLTAAAAIGDDRLQRRARGYVVPESFTHGTSEQRVRWFRTGLETGDIGKCDTFSAGGAP